jgi:hypothetical protein
MEGGREEMVRWTADGVGVTGRESRARWRSDKWEVIVASRRGKSSEGAMMLAFLDGLSPKIAVSEKNDRKGTETGGQARWRRHVRRAEGRVSCGRPI